MASLRTVGNLPRFSSFLANVRVTRQCLQHQARLMSYQERDEDEMTHTGQKFDKDDVRMMRFTDKTKWVNKQHAIDLIAEIPPKACTERVVSCNGGGGPLGHPKVYINLDQPGDHTCGYCGLRFFLEDHH